MHDNQVDVSADELRRLLREQAPQWAHLPIERVSSSGTDNTIYRLGDELVVRLPLVRWAVAQVDLEHTWLPRLAGRLPARVPEPVLRGEPGAGYPWAWSVYRWIDGENPSFTNDAQLAADLAAFVRAIHAIDAPDAPRSVRGAPLRFADEEIRGAIDRVKRWFDVDVLHAMWSDALAAPGWSGQWVTIHGDLSSHNLLMRSGRVHAVIDYSCFGRGDPAVDLDVAWELFDRDARRLYRKAVGYDHDTWRRAQGWAVRAVYGIPYYEHTNPGIVERSIRKVQHAIDDWLTEATPRHAK
jgi:aminoglycoside phosphotransferase (APT) family kinase protein